MSDNRPMSGLRRPLTWSLVAFFALIPFQNCGQKMSSAHSSSSGSSMACRAQLKSEGIEFLAKASIPIDCGNFNDYQCERRIFSPDVETMSHSLKECLGTGDLCVDVDIRQFSTAEARAAGEPAEMFSPGGDYNREEVRCAHRFAYRGVPVFDGEDDNIESAMARAIAACERGVARP